MSPPRSASGHSTYMYTLAQVYTLHKTHYLPSEGARNVGSIGAVRRPGVREGNKEIQILELQQVTQVSGNRAEGNYQHIPV